MLTQSRIPPPLKIKNPWCALRWEPRIRKNSYSLHFDLWSDHVVVFEFSTRMEENLPRKLSLILFPGIGIQREYF